MDETEFWRLIEQAKANSGGDCEEQVRLLAERLAQYPPDDIIAFDMILDSVMALSYDWALWAGAYIVNGGCSDDGFDYFRGWLIAQGKASFFAAVCDPETLVDIVPAEAALRGWVECEDMLYVAREAYEQRTSQELPFRLSEQPREPSGEEWDEETVEERYPNLAQWVHRVQGGEVADEP